VGGVKPAERDTRGRLVLFALADLAKDMEVVLIDQDVAAWIM
jgi:hypothetical protein